MPIRGASDLHKYSPSHYEGFFHTDHLIPSVFFSKERDPEELKLYDDLSFQYIYDAERDPTDHKELMTGAEATWYDVRRNMDRLPDFADPEKAGKLTAARHGRLARWLENRLKEGSTLWEDADADLPGVEALGDGEDAAPATRGAANTGGQLAGCRMNIN
jgi:hypothetical protein